MQVVSPGASDRLLLYSREMNAQHWVHALELREHPEGGYFRETYRSAKTIERCCLPGEYQGERVYSTAIYYLLESNDFSAFHRIHQDELWHFYDGSPLTIHMIHPSGEHVPARLGVNSQRGEQPQVVVPGGTLFGACVDEPNSYTLGGCTVAPGFDFSDFILPSRQHLLAQHPQHSEIIKRLTRF